jgi:hypothetical protein
MGLLDCCHLLFGWHHSSKIQNSGLERTCRYNDTLDFRHIDDGLPWSLHPARGYAFEVLGEAERHLEDFADYKSIWFLCTLCRICPLRGGGRLLLAVPDATEMCQPDRASTHSKYA